MSTFVVPALDEEPWPTLGPAICDLIEERACHGPGDLRGQPASIDDEKRALIYRMYEVFPRDHPRAGRRRFKRVGISLRKGSAKTELAAWVAFAELHPDGPVRTDGWHQVDGVWQPVGRPVTDPYIPMVAYSEEQVEELAYGALLVMCQEGADADLFDAGLERITRIYGDGKAEALASSPNATDGARTSFQHFDEPLALDTKVPTPTGWTTMGELGPDDLVFGRDGQPVRVVGVSPVHQDRPCFRVTFANGTSIVTDSRHLWSSVDRRQAYKGLQAITTEQMASEVRIENYTSRPMFRWAVPMAASLELATADVPVEPYALGVWLGDGDARNATVSQARTDVDELGVHLKAAGFEPTRCKTAPDHAAVLYVRGLRGPLRRAGLLGNKHVPEVYFRASHEQRLALLRGLMDTDGHVTPGGWCTFVSGASRLTGQVAELLRTLGYRPTIVRAEDIRAREGSMWKVSFQVGAEAPFLLARKVARCQGRRSPRQQFNSVVSVERVDSVPVRCIGVDNEDHLFLVGEGFVPTHNTHRMVLARLKATHQTMQANIPKRPIADPWSLETTTTYEVGAGSVAQNTHEYAEQIAQGKVKDQTLFFFHREATPREDEDLEDPEQIRAAIREASGPALSKWTDFEGQIDGIAALYYQPDTDRAYWERVWTNRRVSATRQAFDMPRWLDLVYSGHSIGRGEAVTVGFDGSRWQDSTGLVLTDRDGFQELFAKWEHDGTDDWVVPEGEVDEAVDEIFRRFTVIRMYGDPAQGWDDGLSRWAGKYGPKKVLFYYTDSRNTRKIAGACRAYSGAIRSGAVSHPGDEVFTRHLANSRKRITGFKDEDGQPLWVIEKERRDSPFKIDFAMCGVLSWQARLDGIAAGEFTKPKSSRMVVTR